MSEDKLPRGRKPANRPERTPLGARNRLSFKNLDKGYTYRVINDTDDRLQRAIDAGYEFVESKEQLGDVRVAEGGAVDSRVSKPVGNGTRGFLMRIKDEWFKEDQAAKQAAVDATEESMKPDKSKGQYGAGLTHDKE